MRILFFCPRWPYPALKGDQLIAFNRLRTLSKDHEISLVCFVDRDLSEAEKEPVARYCKELLLFKRTRLESLGATLRQLFNRSTPLQVGYYSSSQLTKILRFLLESGRYDVVHALLLRCATPLRPFASRVVLELVDSMELNFRRQLDIPTGILSKTLAREEHARLRRFEPEVARSFPYKTVVSAIDGEAIGDLALVLPNGVVCGPAKPKTLNLARPRILFHGNLAYHANQAAAKWLLTEIAPRLAQSGRRFELVIAGASAPKWLIAEAAAAGVTLHMDVPQMSHILNSCSIGIAPMRSGSGIQNKVLEAMAAGLPVVATSFAIGGLAKETRDCLLISDDPDGFSSHIVSLLDDLSLRQTRGQASNAAVRRHHSWERAAVVVNGLYNAAMKNPAPWLPGLRSV